MNFRTILASFYITTVLATLLFFGSCNVTLKDQGESVTVDQLRDQLLEEHPNWDKDDICLEEIKEFNNLILVGFFAHDRGCTDFTPFYFGKEKQFNEEFNSRLMASNGYSESPEKLIKAFHLDIINIENYAITELPIKADSSFSALYHDYSIVEEDDIYVSSVWLRHPSGMVNESVYSESIATFDKQTGVLIRADKLHITTIPGN
jgi:hypothetical protein